jgi:hypothetical protein
LQQQYESYAAVVCVLAPSSAAGHLLEQCWGLLQVQWTSSSSTSLQAAHCANLETLGKIFGHDLSASMQLIRSAPEVAFQMGFRKLCNAKPVSPLYLWYLVHQSATWM